MQRGAAALLTSAWQALSLHQPHARLSSAFLQLQQQHAPPPSPPSMPPWPQQLLPSPAPFATRAPGYQGLLPRATKLIRPVTHAGLVQRLNSCQDTLDIRHLMSRHPHVLDHLHTSAILTTLTRLTRLGFVDSAFMQHLMDHAQPHLPDLAPADLAHMLWLMAMLDLQDRRRPPRGPAAGVSVPGHHGGRRAPQRQRQGRARLPAAEEQMSAGVGRSGCGQEGPAADVHSEGGAAGAAGRPGLRRRAVRAADRGQAADHGRRAAAA